MTNLLVVGSLLLLLRSILGSSGSSPSWTYKSTNANCGANSTSPCGPAYWYKVSPQCGSSGTYQSPIKIDVTDVTLDSSIPLPTYGAEGGGCKSWIQFTTQYTFEISFAEAECENLTATYNSEVFYMSQIHFHSPSENTIGGGRFAAEAHMVHKSEEGNLLVVGIFFDVGVGAPVMNNTFLTNFWSAGGWVAPAPGLESTHYVNATGPINPYEGLVPGRQGQYVFQGSLTTPPCSEPVNWFLYDEPVKISMQDLAYLRRSPYDHPNNIMSAEGNNNRPFTQALNGRTVYYTTGNQMASSPTPSPTVSASVMTATIVGSIGLALSGILLFGVIFLTYRSMKQVPQPVASNETSIQMSRIQPV